MRCQRMSRARPKLSAGATGAIVGGALACCWRWSDAFLAVSVSPSAPAGPRQRLLAGGARAGERVVGGRTGMRAEWFPRNSGFTDAELAAERSRAMTLPDPPGYSGPRYTGRGSISDQWINDLLEMQKSDKRLPKKDATLMVLDMIDILGKEPNIPDLSIPSGGSVAVVGDTHGQYWDLFTTLSKTGPPGPSNPVVFNGDMVDRGSWSIEVVLAIFAMKLKDPQFVGINRGNHEMLEANLIYGFCGECEAKYGLDLFDLFSEAFRRLPLGHLVDNKVLIVHAGVGGPDPRIWMPGQTHDPTDSIPLNQNLPTLATMKAVDRNMEVSPDAYKDSIGPSSTDKAVIDERMMIDILWSDPRGGGGYGPSYRKSKGVYMFGPDVSAAFCEANNLQCIIRSHEVKAAGYRWDHPNVVTVFSAPNYLDTGNNKAAVLKLTQAAPGSEITITPSVYEAAKHPDLPPMHWQSIIAEKYPHLTRKMKKVGPAMDFDEFGDSDFAGLMNFDEWEPDEAEAFQDAFKLDEFGRELSEGETRA